mmetsp:Transcript_31311/g.82960  ORF Transcript_31311/g.82960 Transcript_31311/m.82960 type:complete len:218 (+) Transcript_31311:767-1420(+)
MHVLHYRSSAQPGNGRCAGQGHEGQRMGRDVVHVDPLRVVPDADGFPRATPLGLVHVDLALRFDGLERAEDRLPPEPLDHRVDPVVRRAIFGPQSGPVRDGADVVGHAHCVCRQRQQGSDDCPLPRARLRAVAGRSVEPSDVARNRGQLRGLLRLHRDQRRQPLEEEQGRGNQGAPEGERRDVLCAEFGSCFGSIFFAGSGEGGRLLRRRSPDAAAD